MLKNVLKTSKSWAKGIKNMRSLPLSLSKRTESVFSLRQASIYQRISQEGQEFTPLYQVVRLQTWKQTKDFIVID
jgi:hypothetical protein